MQPHTAERVICHWPMLGRERTLAQLQALRSDPAVPSVVLVAEPGFGRSRVLHELVSQVERDGSEAELVVASRSAAAIPLGLFARILPSAISTQLDPLQRFQLAYETFVDRARQLCGAYLLCIDNAHLADEQSAALIHQLAFAPTPFTVVSIAEGEPAPDAIRALLTEDKVENLEIGPLPDEAIGELVRTVLGAPVDEDIISDLARLSEGNPRYLRDLVLSAVDEGSIALLDRCWHAVGPLDPGSQMTELIEAQMQRLTSEERAALEVLAIGEPLDDCVFSAFASPDIQHSLARNEFITFTEHDAGLRVVLKRPRHGRVLEAAICPSSLIEIKQHLAVAIAEKRILDSIDAATRQESRSGLPLQTRLLTTRESEIAALAAACLSSKQIARRLSISARTVDNHLSAVYAKLHLDGRRELARIVGQATSH